MSKLAQISASPKLFDYHHVNNSAIAALLTYPFFAQNKKF